MKSSMTSVAINCSKTFLKPDKKNSKNLKCNKSRGVEEVMIAIVVVRICEETLETKARMTALWQVVSN